MNYSDEIYQWISTSILFIGILLLPVGLGFCLIPDKLFDLAKKMNKWIITDGFFEHLNRPRYRESYFYRHHRIFGLLIMIAAIVSLYILTLYYGVDSVIHLLYKLSDSTFVKWLYVSLYYQLIGFICLAVVFGMVMFIRPSALKAFEHWSNNWIETEKPLKIFDKENNIPDNILPGNPRIFGLFVILGAVYMIWSTWPK